MGIALRKDFGQYSPIIELLNTFKNGDRSTFIGGTPGQTPILRWAGSKKKLLPRLLGAAGSNKGTYYEPFLGSAALFLSLAPRKAVLSDLNPHLIQAYKVTKASPEEVWQLLSRLPSTPDFYYALRSLNWVSLNAVDRAVRFIYLNRYCFNGVYRTNLNGGFNVARGDGHLGIPSWEVFNAFAKKLKRVSVVEGDFEAVLNKAGENDFIYIDPPYIDLGKRNRGEYGAGTFGQNDVTRLASGAKSASDRGAKVLVSYRYSEELIDLFSGWNLQSFDVARSVSCNTGKRASAKEILLTNYC